MKVSGWTVGRRGEGAGTCTPEVRPRTQRTFLSDFKLNPNALQGLTVLNLSQSSTVLDFYHSDL